MQFSCIWIPRIKYIDTFMHTWANWRFDGKLVKYIELYIQTPANNMSHHICKIILVKSCRERFTFVLNEKSPSSFVPIGLYSDLLGAAVMYFLQCQNVGQSCIELYSFQYVYR